MFHCLEIDTCMLERYKWQTTAYAKYLDVYKLIEYIGDKRDAGEKQNQSNNSLTAIRSDTTDIIELWNHTSPSYFCFGFGTIHNNGI